MFVVIVGAAPVFGGQCGEHEPQDSDHFMCGWDPNRETGFAFMNVHRNTFMLTIVNLSNPCTPYVTFLLFRSRPHSFP